MAWEDDVTRVCGAGRPREVFALAERWRKLGDALVDLQVHVSRIGTKTANDGDLPKEAARYVTVVPQGNSWTGTAADAFREHVAKLAEDIGEVTQAVLKVSASVDRAGEALCAGISRTPVPVFFDRDLPNGVDVEDVVNGQAVGGDSGTVFAKRLTEDISKGQKYYESGTGFKKKLDDTLQFSGDGVVREGKSQGSTPGIAWWEGWHTERYKRERDQWYAQNAGVAETAFGDLRTAYSTERRNVAPEELRARTDVSAATPFGVDPAGPRKPAGVPPMPDSLTGDAGAGAARMPDVGAAGAGGLGSTGGAHFEPPGSNVVPTKAEHLDGSSLAGAGGGLGGAGSAAGLGGAGSVGGLGGAGSVGGLGNVGGAGGGAGLGGVAGLGGSGGSGRGAGVRGGTGGIGRVPGGTGIPGMIAPGSANAGPGRSPMPPLTSANRAMSIPQPRPSGGNAGLGAGGMGMMPGGMGGHGAGGGEGTAQPADWLTEDDDVWGGGADDVPPGVLGR